MAGALPVLERFILSGGVELSSNFRIAFGARGCGRFSWHMVKAFLKTLGVALAACPPVHYSKRRALVDKPALSNAERATSATRPHPRGKGEFALTGPAKNR